MNSFIVKILAKYKFDVTIFVLGDLQYFVIFDFGRFKPKILKIIKMEGPRRTNNRRKIAKNDP